MFQKKDVSITLDDRHCELRFHSLKTENGWVFIVNNAESSDGYLLPNTIYLHFDQDKNYSSCYPYRAVTDRVAEAIAEAIKKLDYNWTAG